jgi:hypothetical protein
MSGGRFSSTRIAALLLAGCLAGGCAQTFGIRAAKEISRDELLSMADRGKANHVRYMGSDEAYHYVYNTRDGEEGSYKVRADRLRLEQTFRVGDDDSYILWPWLIEGKRLGAKPE